MPGRSGLRQYVYVVHGFIIIVYIVYIIWLDGPMHKVHLNIVIMYMWGWVARVSGPIYGYQSCRKGYYTRSIYLTYTQSRFMTQAKVGKGGRGVVICDGMTGLLPSGAHGES